MRTLYLSALVCAGTLLAIASLCAQALSQPPAATARPSAPVRQPRAREILDRFGETQKAIRDRFRSHLIVTETTILDDSFVLLDGRRIRNPGLAVEIEQRWTDGERFLVRETDPLFLRDPDLAEPNDCRQRAWIWDGQTYAFLAENPPEYAQRMADRHGRDTAHRDNILRRQCASAQIYLDAAEPETRKLIRERRPSLGATALYEQFRQARSTAVVSPPGPGDPNGLWLLELHSGKTVDRVWFDPAHGWNIARREVIENGRKTYIEWDAVFRQIEGLWIPVEKKFQYSHSDGRYSEARHLYRIPRLVADPDHEALASFFARPREGADVRLYGRRVPAGKRPFLWRNGQVEDAAGKVLWSWPGAAAPVVSADPNCDAGSVIAADVLQRFGARQLLQEDWPGGYTSLYWTKPIFCIASVMFFSRMGLVT